MFINALREESVQILFKKCSPFSYECNLTTVFLHRYIIAKCSFAFQTPVNALQMTDRVLQMNVFVIEYFRAVLAFVNNRLPKLELRIIILLLIFFRRRLSFWHQLQVVHVVRHRFCCRCTGSRSGSNSFSPCH